MCTVRYSVCFGQLFCSPFHIVLFSSCMQDIVGARFHCAVCPSVDICSNCESAGLPGNLDEADGGHSSSHIMIKIPYPLSSEELQVASRRVKQLWDRDAQNLDTPPRSRRDSLTSSYARTVMAASGSSLDVGTVVGHGNYEDHGLRCGNCAVVRRFEYRVLSV